MPSIAKVVVQLSLNREFDYRIPERLAGQLRLGMPVIVPFGHAEARGYVIGLADSSPHARLKEIKDIVGDKSLLAPGILELAHWISSYYAAPIEQVIRTVLPSPVRHQKAGFIERLRVRPTPRAGDEEAIRRLRARAPKQAAALDLLLGGGPMFLNHLARAAKTTAGTIRGLEEKGFVAIEKHADRRDPLAGHTILRTEPLELMPQQAAALDLIKRSIATRQPPVVLLYGVTGSGKTEVYLQAIRHVLDRDQGVIVLVPEIALTPQTIERFRGRFGEDIAVLHSSLSEGERHDEWHRVHEGQARIVIGARSALFAPVRNLGLIVVDEEHEPTYKQAESPRYNARDVAVMRGRMESCAVLLGTATPALESFQNTRNGKYGLARLPARVDHRQMPVMRIVDMRVAGERGGRVTVMSRELIEAIRLRLDRAEQTMLFLNRRGYASSVVCPRCGYVAQCDHCSVALTYHRQSDQVVCHICGALRRVPARCPAPDCGDPQFKFAGLGTERIESIVRRLFPRARVQRMDADTTTRKGAHHEILGAFRTGQIDILVGTQMIAKGLHFPNVTLVGVVFADLSLHMPDFRAAERTFQLLTQVAGRAGRGDIRGEVIVQTYTPFHPAIQAARQLDYDRFFDQEIEFRRELGYPPFTHLVCVTLKGPVNERVQAAATALAAALRPALDARVVLAGPAPAPLARAKGHYRHQLMLRAPLTRLITDPLKNVLGAFKCPPDVTYAVDVDAIALM